MKKLSTPDEPTTLLWNILNQSLPEQADYLRQQMRASTANSNAMNKKYNPGLNQRGLELAAKAQPLFTDPREWQLFRKFLEKHFANI
mgnify:CR=1 FL=1